VAGSPSAFPRADNAPGDRERMTRPEIVRAIRRWYELYGEPPTMADWDPYRARQIDQTWRIARFRDGNWPSVQTVRNKFGRLSDAIAAAGLVPRYQGERRPNVDLVLDDDVRLHLAYLRALRDSTRGPDQLARALREVALARPSPDSADLKVALIELAAAALAWADEARD
jgi:hypothetical protein